MRADLQMLVDASEGDGQSNDDAMKASDTDEPVSDTLAMDTERRVLDDLGASDVDAATGLSDVASPGADIQTTTDAVVVSDSNSTNEDGIVLDDTMTNLDDIELSDTADTETPFEPDVGNGSLDSGTMPGDEDTALETPDVPAPPACEAVVTVDSPAPNAFFALGEGVPVSAIVNDPNGQDLTGFQVEWRDVTGTLLATSAVDALGATSATLVGVQKGQQDIRAVAIDQYGPCTAETLHPLLMCSSNVVEDFNASLSAPWTVFGDASWSSNGYIEMTGIAQGKKGAVYNTAEYIIPGSVSIRFEVLTGGGSGSGADGFAMTIVETDDPTDLPGLLTAAKSGGGLAYASQGAYGNPYNFKAFTVEIDTWFNTFNGNNEFHTDPTTDDHVELTLDLDAGNSIAFTSAGEIEDQAWHSIRVDVVGTLVKVWLDEVLKVEQMVPALDFRGGYIFFSGSTGYYTNYHRFENLQIIHDCKAVLSPGS